MAEPVMGIDLGTTYSCVGVIHEGKVEILASNVGKRIVPSVVGIRPSAADGDYDFVIGDAAKDESWNLETSVIYCAKRLIGRTFDDPHVQEDLRVWPFKVINVEGKPKYQVEVQGKIHTFFPEEISAQVLIKLKSMADDYLSKDVKKAVITVPAYFNENQRQATKDAARIAGLEVLDLLSEPNAAAIAYGADLQREKDRHLLVFDFGGGTFDVSVITIKQDGVISVRAIHGHPHLGGEDIDNRIALHFEELFNKKNKTQLRADDARAWRRLKHSCEKLKICLSSKPLENLRIPSIHKGQDLIGSMNKAKLEAANEEFFQKTISITQDVIKASTLKKDDIKDILLVGGSTRIPLVKKLIQELLPNAKIAGHQELNVDEAVAVGATIMAALKTEVFLVRRPVIKLWSVIPQSLGIGTGRGLMYHFIHRNTCVPVSESMILSTDKDNQTIIRFKVFEGEDRDTSKNYYLGEFRIAGIPPAPRGLPQVEVTFAVDENCKLHVRAQDLSTGRARDLNLQYDHERLSERELEQLQTRAQNAQKRNEEVQKRLAALHELEEFAKAVRVSCMKEPIKSNAPKQVDTTIDEIYSWVDTWFKEQKYPAVSITKSKKKELEDLWTPFITEFNKQSRRAEPPLVFD